MVSIPEYNTSDVGKIVHGIVVSHLLKLKLKNKAKKR